MGGGEEDWRKGLKVTSTPPLRTTQAKWPVGEALVLRERSEREIPYRLIPTFPLILSSTSYVSLFLSHHESVSCICPFLSFSVIRVLCCFFMKTAKSVSLTAALPWTALWCLKSLNAVYIFFSFNFLPCLFIMC